MNLLFFLLVSTTTFVHHSYSIIKKNVFRRSHVFVFTIFNFPLLTKFSTKFHAVFSSWTRKNTVQIYTYEIGYAHRAGSIRGTFEEVV